MNKDTDVKAFNLAKKFLLENTPDEVDEKLLDHYLKQLNVAGKNIKLSDLYFRLLSSAQNANMKAGVIGKSIGGVDKLSKVLFNFDPKTVIKHYGNDSEKVFNAIVSELKPTGKIRQSPMRAYGPSTAAQSCLPLTSSRNLRANLNFTIEENNRGQVSIIHGQGQIKRLSC